MNRLSLVLVWGCCLLQVQAALGRLPDLEPDQGQREKIRRTLTLLNTSTAERPNTVRILFYGQSITRQDWWVKVVRTIQSHYPTVDLRVENRAINGYTVDRLRRTAEADVYPFQPDLMVFYAYGPEADHERLLGQIRLRAVADLLWLNDHVAQWDGEPGETVVPGALQPDNPNWHNLVYLPQAAERHGACLVDVRTPWEAYLRTNQLSLTNLLEDGLHLNADGRELLAAIVSPYFAPQPERVAPDPNNTYGVTTYELGAAVHWINGALALPIQGSRVDVVLGPGAVEPVEVWIDAQPPGKIPGAWAFTRASSAGDLGAPVLLRVGSSAPLQAEFWQVTVTESGAGGFAFQVHGSLTGADGAGTNTMTFRSDSGRVVLRPEDWLLQAPEVGLKVTWQAVPLHVGRFWAVPPEGNGESVITVVQNAPDTLHTLLLKSSPGTRPAIRAIRVFSPTERRLAVGRPPGLRRAADPDGTVRLRWPGWLPGWRLETAAALAPGQAWAPVSPIPTNGGGVDSTQLWSELASPEPAGFYRLRLVEE